jgi:prepilin-type N-terminal cleavage/methylation domain-containing protein
MTHSRGFTLAEMAMAMAILALLLFGAMVPFSTQVEVRNVAETRRTMDSIKDAIVGFAQANGRVPCPALGTTPTGAAGAGTEQLAGNSCSASFGVLPWATLGTPETDSWGRRFSYWVSPIFADTTAAGTTNSAGQTPDCTAPNPAPTQSSFALCSLGVITLSTRNEASHTTVTPLGSGLPLVFISHGKNGRGAFLASGTVVAAPNGSDEIANSTGNRPPGATPTFYSRPPTQAPSSSCNDAAAGTFCEFDDIVVTIPSSTLIARMVAAGKLP